jgi:hypothetical protein
MTEMADPGAIVNEGDRDHPRTTQGAASRPDASWKAVGNTATVVAFTPPKRRGRPRKPRPVDRSCKDDFDTVAMAVVGIANKQTLWSASKERVRRWADRDRCLRPASTKVLGYLLEHINKRAGYDWHDTDTIAGDLGLSVSAVEKAFGELIPGGYLLRQSEAVSGRRKATRRWRTTIPALMGAAKEVSAEREARARARLGMTPAGSGPGQKMDLDPDKKAVGPGQKNRDGPGQISGCSLREPIKTEPINESPGCAGDDLDHHEQQSKVERPVGKTALQEEPVARSSATSEGVHSGKVPKTALQGEPVARSAATSQGVHSGTVPKSKVVTPAFRPPPRFDQSLPMEDRLSIPGGRYAVPQGSDDQKVLTKMRRAARGWDLHDLRAKYVAWAVSANTRDAIEGFITWTWKYVEKPAIGYVDLGSAARRSPAGADITAS